MNKVDETYRPRIGSAQIKLLERLSNACAVSGDEGEVRKIVLEELKPHVDEIKVDALGNVLALQRGTGEAPRLKVMLDAHMDEVGFMITRDDGDGIFQFDIVGGLDARHLVGKPVWIGRDHVPGVIGAKPIHLTHDDEMHTPISIDTLRIDIGPGVDKVKIGDRVVFATCLTRLGPSLRGKALDDRIGVVTLIELLKHAPVNLDLLVSFSVQEEIGLRGARVAAFSFTPDIAFVLDCTPAYDQPTWDQKENVSYNTLLGSGPALYIADSATLSDPRLLRFLAQTADDLKIPYQYRQPGGGGTDAGSIHKQRAGIPCVSISVPCRYLHTPASIIRLEDWRNSLALLNAVLQRLTPDVLSVQR